MIYDVKCPHTIDASRVLAAIDWRRSEIPPLGASPATRVLYPLSDLGVDEVDCPFSGPVEFALMVGTTSRGWWGGLCPECGGQIDVDPDGAVRAPVVERFLG